MNKMNHRAFLVLSITGLLFMSGIVFGDDSEGGNSSENDFVYVCTDGGNGGYEAFPDVCRLVDGRLMVVFYDGWTHVSLPEDKPGHQNGARISCCLSSDEGKTWSEPRVIIDTPYDDRDPSILALADGRLYCNWFTYRKLDNDRVQCDLMLSESINGGQSWFPPKVIFENVPCSTPIRPLSNGRLILPTYVENNSEHCGSAAYSDDNGRTWSANIIIPNGGMRLDAETDVIELKDGTLYAIQREEMAYSLSHDRGETWSESQPVGFAGHCPYLLRLRDDTIVMAFRLPNTSLRFSRDECKTWSDNVVVDDVIGAYPSMVELKDGSVLIVYYEEGGGSNIRAKRFRIKDDDTVEWLSLR
ncbi:MAG: exo-alpha-sialidase [Thermoguttaceae bacterium]|nr:exo-alpha-sialidase [Thermoguttaceae bacterium]